jgi:hypothetical protein
MGRRCRRRMRGSLAQNQPTLAALAPTPVYLHAPVSNPVNQLWPYVERDEFMLRHHRRVFTTKGTENTEGMRREAIIQNCFSKNCLPPHPLCALCELCGEYHRARKRGPTNHSRLWLCTVSVPAGTCPHAQARLNPVNQLWPHAVRDEFMLRHHRRVFTTEGTENTEGMRRKQSLELPYKENCLPPHPLSVLCALCGEYHGARKRGPTHHS